ncbi:MAG TPA: hypothetical protein VJZ27_17575 [Aggregatilineales bacterium]|nr:hypothetical protein [Aggregatilineales bacterium]
MILTDILVLSSTAFIVQIWMSNIDFNGISIRTGASYRDSID